MTRQRRRPGPIPVVVTAIATFLAVLVLLAVQLQAGRDPVLGGAPVAALHSGHHAKVVTRTSGGGQAVQQQRGAGSKPVTTRASAVTGEVEDD
jgi:hypothetical protein